MNKLKEMLERKRKTAAAESGDRKVINRAELEDYRHQQRRQEEEQELAEKVSTELPLYILYLVVQQRAQTRNMGWGAVQLLAH